MSKIRVGLRVRPLSEREVTGGFPVVVAVEDNSAFITDIRVPERPKADSRARYRQFDFDHAFWLEESAGEGASQSEVYREMGPPLEKSVLQGYNACLLAYGQSGTGKTHTMLGSKEDPGIIPRLCNNIWNQLKSVEELDGSFGMEVSFMEIYREKVRDLLNPQSQLKLREHPQFGPHVQNLSRIAVVGANGLLDLLWEGECRRAIGTTGSNRRSSRSHAIWTIYLTRNKVTPSNSKSATTKTLITNQVHLVDLAGSEKAGFATTKNLLAEGADINRSLVALGNVISNLAEKAQYIPYRDSALTWLLKDSLGGNATTAIIITSSPASSCHAQTLNSFRFAQRARLVENSPRINLTSGSPAGSRRGSGSGSAALYSIMSAFEIKKDISKLSRVIESAQNNGGLLRGLAPRASWTRLINALEGWNQIEAEHVKLQRAASEDTTTTSVTSASTATDAMIQADMISSLLEPSSSSSADSANSSKMNSPTRIIGTEVFIPTSSSIKCLTWQQEEPVPVPKPPPPPLSSVDEDEKYGSCKMTPPMTPTSGQRSRPQQKRLQYLLPVQYPVTQHLDHASRISERIHGSFSGEGPKEEKIQPSFEPNYLSEGDSPLIRERIPTLVNPKEISPIFRTCSEKDVGLKKDKIVPVRCKSVEEFIIPEDSSEEEVTLFEREFSTPSNQFKFVVPFEKTDFNFLSQKGIQGEEVNLNICQGNKLRSPRYRTVNSSTPKRQNLLLKMPPYDPSEFLLPERKKSTPIEKIDHEEVTEEEMTVTELIENNPLGSKFRMVPSYKTPNMETDYPWVSPEDETFCYFPSESALSSMSTNSSNSSSISNSSSCSSSSSLTKVPVSSKNPVLVQVIPEELDSVDEFLDESVFDIQDFQDHLENYKPRSIMTRILLEDESEIEDIEEVETLEEGLIDIVDIDETHRQRVANAATGSKFRNHFAKEYLQMEEVGNRLRDLKKLMQMSQRFDVAKPFLDEISILEKQDHSKPEPKLDEEIDNCCGWNVDIELKKVNSEINSLNKLLKTGITPSQDYASSSCCRRDSSTSTATIASTMSNSTGTPQSPRARYFPGIKVHPNSEHNLRPSYSLSSRFPQQVEQNPRVCYSQSDSHVPDHQYSNYYNNRSNNEASAHFSNFPQYSNPRPALPSYLQKDEVRRAQRPAAHPSDISSSFSSSAASSSLNSDHHFDPMPQRWNVNPLDEISNCSSYDKFESVRSISTMSRDSGWNINEPHSQGHQPGWSPSSHFQPPSNNYFYPPPQEPMGRLNGQSEGLRSTHWTTNWK